MDYVVSTAGKTVYAGRSNVANGIQGAKDMHDANLKTMRNAMESYYSVGSVWD